MDYTDFKIYVKLYLINILFPSYCRNTICCKPFVSNTIELKKYWYIKLCMYILNNNKSGIIS